MTDVVESPPAADGPSTDPTEALVERIFTATIDSLEIASVHLGSTLGFYRALADGGDATPAELAARTGTAERYVREWLEQQAVAGFLTVDDPDAEAGDRRYSLPAAHRPVFVDEEDLNHLAPLSSLVIGVCGPMAALLRGLPQRRRRALRGLRRRHARGDRRDQPAACSSTSSPDWLAADPRDRRAPARASRRRASPTSPAAPRWSSIAIARAYPRRDGRRRSTSTPPRSRPPAPTSRPPAWPTGSARPCRTPATRT